MKKKYSFFLKEELVRMLLEIPKFETLIFLWKRERKWENNSVSTVPPGQDNVLREIG